MAQASASLDSVLSFAGSKPVSSEEEYREGEDGGASVDSGDDDDDSFEFAFAPPLLGATGQQADACEPADDIFAHGRILPAYPVFDRRRHLLPEHEQSPLSSSSSSTAAPEPDTYCAWVPRSAPASPERDAGAGAVTFPKSASTGEPRRPRLRDVLVGSSGRSHSDGKEKFVFLQPSPTPNAAVATVDDKRGKKAAPADATPSSSQKQQGHGRKKKGAVTEMDMATAHRLFYSKTGTAASAGGERKPQTSYLTYRPAFVGFFAAAAHGIGRSSHHPY